MKKLITFIASVLLILCSCSSSYKTITITDNKEKIQTVKAEHPAIYSMMQDGQVVVVEVQKRYDKKTDEYMGSRVLIGRGMKQ